MGVSTDAILCFGFEIEEDSDEHDRCHLLMDEKYEVLSKAESKYGGSLVHHCSDGCTLYIVGIRETKAWRGYPKEVTSLDVTDDERAKLADFAKAIGIEPKAPKWLLCSWWG